MVPGRILVRMKPGHSPDRLLNETALARIDRIPRIEVDVLAVPEGREETVARALSRRPDVLYAEPDGIMYAAAVPNDSYYFYQWHLPQIQAPTAWDYTTGSSGVVVAVLDTGVDTEHPDLKGKLLTGYNAFTKNSRSNDDNGHGTYVAGIAAAITNNQMGVAGVSWGAKILPVKVLDATGTGANSVIADGITWAADQNAKVLNLSLGGTGHSQTLANAVKYAAGKGSLVLAAMGNEYLEGNPVTYPAAYPEAMAVGATNDVDARSRYSNTGSHISVAAPGGEILSSDDTNPRHAIWSTYPVSKGSYAGADGTSAATPVVSGLAALLWTQAPTYTAAQIRQVIEQTAVDLGPAGKDNETGNGRIDAFAAMESIAGPPPDTVAPTASISSPVLSAALSGTVATTGTVTDDRALKSFQVQYGSGVSPATWFNLGPAQTQPVTNATLASWNTVGLTDGTYTLRVTAVDAANNIAVSPFVSVSVNNTQTTLNVTAGADTAKTGGSFGLTVQASQSMKSTPALTASGACIEPSSVPLSSLGGNAYSGSYLVPAGSGDCAVTFTASGTDRWGKAALNGSDSVLLDRTPPTALDQGVGTDEDLPLEIGLSATDANSLTYSIQTGPQHGTLGPLNGNRITYTPTPDFHGMDSFSFTASDGLWDSAPATVTITVQPVNDLPAASGQTVATEEDKPVGVTLNGSDPDGDSLTYTIVTPPAHGVLSGTAPDLTFTPSEDFFGTDSFTFKVGDGQAESGAATVQLTIHPVNDPPLALGQAVSIEEDTPQAIRLSASDAEGDALTYVVVTPPQHGVLSGAAPDLVYTPAADYHGSDEFTYRAGDGQAESDTVTVTLTVLPVNDAPLALNGSATTLQGNPVAIVLGGTDPEGSALAYSLLTQPGNGTLSGTAPHLLYTPAPGFTGSDSFSFTVGDGQAESGAAVFSLQVLSPLVVIDSAEAVPGETTTLSVRITESVDRLTGLDLRLRVDGPEGAPVLVPDVVLGAQAQGWIIAHDPEDPLRITLSGPEVQGPAELAMLILRTPEDVPAGTVYLLEARSAALTEEGESAYEASSQVQSGSLTIGTCEPRLTGDGTGDGSLDVADAVFALRVSVGLERPVLCSLLSSDVDCDGAVTVTDGVSILRHLVSGVPFPVCSN